jgi:hypothetical protein
MERGFYTCAQETADRKECTDFCHVWRYHSCDFISPATPHCIPNVTFVTKTRFETSSLHTKETTDDS